MFTSFVKKTVTSVPLRGALYEVDIGSVHQAVVSFTIGKTSENWIKSVSRYRDVSRSMETLGDHFSGKEISHVGLHRLTV